jgi:RHS repeat-associated protein
MAWTRRRIQTDVSLRTPRPAPDRSRKAASGRRLRANGILLPARGEVAEPGLRRTPGERVNSEGFRGFKSPPLRHAVFNLRLAAPTICSNRLTSETTPQGAVSYTYDAAGRRLTMMVPGQSTLNYTWDNANRLTGITQGTSSVGLAYDNANRRTTLTLPNGVTVSYTYDFDSHVTGLTYALGGTQLGNLTYAYDANGRVITKGGSLAAVNLPATVSGNSFNTANEMTAFNGSALTYDANGNLTGEGTNTYTWDARNHLSAVSGATTASFVYDAFGRRMSKALNGVTTEFLYDGLNPVQELNGGNPPSPTANLLTGLDIDEYFTRTDTSGVMSLLADALGSTVALADSSSINTSYTYEPFGKTTVTGSNANPYQFTGRENDGTGLYFYRARYYSPTYQRFIAQDPALELLESSRLRLGPGDSVNTQLLNAYTYSANSPLSLKDPFGLSPSSCGPNEPDCKQQALNALILCITALQVAADFPISIAAVGCSFTAMGAPVCIAAVAPIVESPSHRGNGALFMDVRS